MIFDLSLNNIYIIMTQNKLERFYIITVSQYIKDKTTFLNLMCVNKKLKTINKWFNTIVPPFENRKLFTKYNGDVIEKQKQYTEIWSTDNTITKETLMNISNEFNETAYNKFDKPWYKYKCSLNQNKLNKGGILNLKNVFCCKFEDNITHVINFNPENNECNVVLPKNCKQLINSFNKCKQHVDYVILPKEIRLIRNCFNKTGQILIVSNNDGKGLYINNSFK
jgi:hypothetical protein